MNNLKPRKPFLNKTSKFFRKSNKIYDDSLNINISAMTQPNNNKQGWIFDCHYCKHKTHNSIKCYYIYEIYVCNNCQTKYKKDNKKLHELAKYCKEIANKKIK